MVNLAADAGTLQVDGQQHVSVYRSTIERDGKPAKSRHERHFCKLCGSHLWAFNSRWPELLHPVASAIDTELPTPPELVHMMTGDDSRASWVQVTQGSGDQRFDRYPEQSLADWHRSRGLQVD